MTDSTEFPSPPPKRPLSRGTCRFLSIMFGLGILGAVLIVLMILPFKYAASVDILVRIDRDASPIPQVGGPSSDQIVVTGVRPEDVATEISLLTGRAVAETAYETLGPIFFEEEEDIAENFRQRIVFTFKDVLETGTNTVEAALVRLRLSRESIPREDAISDIMRSLDVSKSVRSDLISLRVKSGSPAEATAILAAIADAYFEAHRQARAVFRGSDLFRDLQSETERQMTGLGQDIEAIKRDIDVYDFPLWIEQRTEQLADLREEEEELALDLRALSMRIADAETDLSALEAAEPEAEPLNNNDLIASFREEIGRATRDMERDIVRFGRSAQQVLETQAAIAALRAEMRSTDIAETGRLLQALRRERTLLELRDERIGEQAESVAAEISAVSAREADLRVMETRLAALGSSLTQVSGEQMRSDWLAALDINGPARIQVLEPVTVSRNPVSPNKVVILLAGIAAAVLAGIGLYIVLLQVFVLPRETSRAVPAMAPSGGDWTRVSRALVRGAGQTSRTGSDP